MTFPGYNMLLFSVLEPLCTPKCKMRPWRGLPVPLTGETVLQLGCKANKSRECDLCCASPSLLAFEVKKQSGSWSEASCLAMWVDTERLPNS